MRATTEIDRLIQDAGWFNGTQTEWERLSSEEREQRAFKATGCLIAYATWKPPVNCSHTDCQMARGEIPAMVALNRGLQAERRDGWLRHAPRDKLAKLYRAYRKTARETGVYDPWKIGWQGMVFTGLAS